MTWVVYFLILRPFGPSRCSAQVLASKVDGLLLLNMDEDDFRELGITKRLHQRKIDIALKKYKLRYERREAGGDADAGEHDHSGHGHGDHDHGDHDHGSSGFMSMVEVTKDLPRSADGLAMDWLEVPFGPCFPGLPGGLRLTLTLDGDGVTEGQATSLVAMGTPSEEVAVETFIERLAAATPLAPVSYRLLACRAIEQAARRWRGGRREDFHTDRREAVRHDQHGAVQSV